ncbi:hypothetical protein Baya_10525 [Bagarius yarrelli]|uniref:Uncharacterized protein n=1 Tax=Bagarius yarrelli TaxID=175774 RepID=A0A556UFP9_BAGYA|nr:hypothetical protein Baya_10525 [Bagarius yarrelli]
MGEKASETVVSTVPDQLEGQEEEKSRSEGEGKETVQGGEEENDMDDHMKNNKQERPVSKNKPGRVQSVFTLVKNQIRGQPRHEVSRVGMVQLVQQVTRQLDRTYMEQEVFEDTSPRKEDQETVEVQETVEIQETLEVQETVEIQETLKVQETVEVQEETVDLENDQTKEQSKKDECVDLLRQLLKRVEGLSKELAEEFNLLRQESRSNTDKLLQELVNLNTNASDSVPPPPGAPKRRLLRRTLTSMAPKNSTAQTFRPRCMSEPVGGRNAEIRSTGNGNGTFPMSSVLPSLVVTQHAKKSVHKPRVNIPQS